MIRFLEQFSVILNFSFFPTQTYCIVSLIDLFVLFGKLRNLNNFFY